MDFSFQGPHLGIGSIQGVSQGGGGPPCESGSHGHQAHHRKLFQWGAGGPCGEPRDQDPPRSTQEGLEKCLAEELEQLSVSAPSLKGCESRGLHVGYSLQYADHKKGPWCLLFHPRLFPTSWMRSITSDWACQPHRTKINPLRSNKISWSCLQ